MAKQKKKNKKPKFKKSKNINMMEWSQGVRYYNKIATELDNKRFKKLEAEFDEMKIKKTREMTQSVFEELFINLLGVPLLTLRNEGWGKKRLEYFFNEMMTIFKDFHEKRLTTDDMAEAIKNETGFDLLAEKVDFIAWLRTINLQDTMFVYTSEEIENEEEIKEKIKREGKI